MVELGNNWDQDEECDFDLFKLLDFPMESLEGDGLEEVWNLSISDCLGPIPSDILTGLPSIPNPPCLLPGSIAPIAGTPEQKQLPNHVSASSSHIRESAAFETQSPISVLESSGSCLGGKSLSFKLEKAVPVGIRSKRVRPVGVNPWLLEAPVFSTPQKTLNTKRSKEIKKCLHCESTKTPQWREGPMGPKTLCNACGVRYRSGRLFPEYRPASSPSFVPSKHSNAHKKVIEMRNKAIEPAGAIKVAPKSSLPAITEEPPQSPPLEFVPMCSYFFENI